MFTLVKKTACVPMFSAVSMKITFGIRLVAFGETYETGVVRFENMQKVVCVTEQTNVKAIVVYFNILLIL